MTGKSTELMKKTIYLHGHLAEKHPEPIVVEAETIAEAIRALSTIDALAPPLGQAGWPVQVDGIENEIQLFSRTSVDEIHIRPRLGGAGGNTGLTQVLIGVAMVALAVWNPAFLAAIPGGLVTPASLFLTGGLMITGGLLQMMMPMPDASEGEDPSSKVTGGTANTVTIGTRITLAYGFCLLGGHYLSYDVDATDWTEDDDAASADLVQTLPANSAAVGIYPLPGATNGSGETQGVYRQFDRQNVEYTIVQPVFANQATGPGNVPTSGWIV